MNKKILWLVVLIVLCIIGGYLWMNDTICFGGKNVNGIYVEEELRIASDDYHGINYCQLLKKAIDGNQEDIKKLILLDFSGAAAAGYDHGDVIVQLIDRLGEETIISSLGSPLTKKEKETIKSYINAGLEYGNNRHQGQALEVAFPRLNQYLTLTAEMAYQGVSNYCHSAYDWSIAEENPSIMSIKMGEETESEYQVIFRSYTGAIVYFYVDKTSGTTRMVEYVPTLDVENEAGTIDLFDYIEK